MHSRDIIRGKFAGNVYDQILIGPHHCMVILLFFSQWFPKVLLKISAPGFLSSPQSSHMTLSPLPLSIDLCLILCYQNSGFLLWTPYSPQFYTSNSLDTIPHFLCLCSNLGRKRWFFSLTNLSTCTLPISFGRMSLWLYSLSNLQSLSAPSQIHIDPHYHCSS